MFLPVVAKTVKLLSLQSGCCLIPEKGQEVIHPNKQAMSEGLFSGFSRSLPVHLEVERYNTVN